MPLNLKDKIPGGKADHKDLSKYDPEQLIKGILIEVEHTDDIATAIEIASDHLEESPTYYDHLEDMEKDMKKSKKANNQELMQQLEDLAQLILNDNKKEAIYLLQDIRQALMLDEWSESWETKEAKSRAETIGVEIRYSDGTEELFQTDDESGLDNLLIKEGILNFQEVEHQIWNYYESEPLYIEGHEVDPDVIETGSYPKHIIIWWPERSEVPYEYQGPTDRWDSAKTSNILSNKSWQNIAKSIGVENE